MEITESSGQYSLDYSDEISGAILDDYYNFKAQAFYDIAQAYNSRNFDDVTKICKYMLQFSADEDFTNEQTTLKKLPTATSVPIPPRGKPERPLPRQKNRRMPISPATLPAETNRDAPPDHRK